LPEAQKLLTTRKKLADLLLCLDLVWRNSTEKIICIYSCRYCCIFLLVFILVGIRVVVYTMNNQTGKIVYKPCCFYFKIQNIYFYSKFILNQSVLYLLTGLLKQSGCSKLLGLSSSLFCSGYNTNFDRLLLQTTVQLVLLFGG
jgi:hypothetical protein